MDGLLFPDQSSEGRGPAMRIAMGTVELFRMDHRTVLDACGRARFSGHCCAAGPAGRHPSAPNANVAEARIR